MSVEIVVIVSRKLCNAVVIVYNLNVELCLFLLGISSLELVKLNENFLVLLAKILDLCGVVEQVLDLFLAPICEELFAYGRLKVDSSAGEHILVVKITEKFVVVKVSA